MEIRLIRSSDVLVDGTPGTGYALCTIPVLLAGVKVSLDPVKDRRPQKLCCSCTLLAANVDDEPLLVLFRGDELNPFANLLSNRCLVCLVVLMSIACRPRKKLALLKSFCIAFVTDGRVTSVVGAIPRS